ncbi:hypothetical protein MCT03_08885 [Vibrio aestuarianus]|nr:hypothetical protein [Vibrio aestuarianus]MDE1211890.1 hypothetical protein [Vibrio aestuarianus]MDE1224401.1 hypothetical protein [Vibrio aestuarianus]MDE1255013.1 hypothetical protein [Vibrio aestuarianus]MDE1340768.1 hypothetical protein [Vibrio aestuarianus]
MKYSAAFNHASNAAYGVLKMTEEAGSWELETILAPDDFSAVKVAD